jgi:hypothetical protein
LNGYSSFSSWSSTGQIEFSWFGIEILPVESDEFTHAESGVGEQRDDRLVASLEVVRKDVGKAGVTDVLDLFGGEPGGGLFLCTSA